MQTIKQSYLYVWLPEGNSSEFEELETEMIKRGVSLEYTTFENGDRIYRLPEKDLLKLPVDDMGFYFGTEDSGYNLNRRKPESVEADGIKYRGSDWVKA